MRKKRVAQRPKKLPSEGGTEERSRNEPWESSRLEEKYEQLMEQREADEWPKLFSPEFRQRVLEEIEATPSQLFTMKEAMLALDRFVDEVGDPSGSARSLLDRLSKIGGELAETARDVEHLWLKFLSDPCNRDVLPDPVDVVADSEFRYAEEVGKSERARERGKLSGEARREKRDSDITKAAEALKALATRERMEPEDFNLKDIEKESGIRYPRLRSLTLVKIRERVGHLRKE